MKFRDEFLANYIYHFPMQPVVLRQPVHVERERPLQLREGESQQQYFSLGVEGLPVPGVLANTLLGHNMEHQHQHDPSLDLRQENLHEEVTRLREENSYLRSLLQSFISSGGAGWRQGTSTSASASSVYPQFDVRPQIIPLEKTTSTPSPPEPVVLRFKGNQDNRFIIPIFSSSAGEDDYRDYPRDQKKKRKATSYQENYQQSRNIFDDFLPQSRYREPLYPRDSWRSRLSRILTRSKRSSDPKSILKRPPVSRSERSSDSKLILERPSVLQNSISDQAKLSPVRKGFISILLESGPSGPSLFCLL